jgi:hypothetical protein
MRWVSRGEWTVLRVLMGSARGTKGRRGHSSILHEWSVDLLLSMGFGFNYNEPKLNGMFDKKSLEWQMILLN